MERWANDEVWGRAAQRELLDTLADLGRVRGGYHAPPSGVRARLERHTVGRFELNGREYRKVESRFVGEEERDALFEALRLAPRAR